MSLLQRVERVRQGADMQNAGVEVPIAPPAPPTPPPAPVMAPARAPAREEMLRDITNRMQSEVVGSFGSGPELSPAELRSKIEGLVDRVIAQNGFAVTREERLRLIDEMVHEVTGFGPLEPFLLDETITEVMVNGPDHIYIERDGKIERVDVVFQNDEHVRRIIDRIITPMGRRIDESSPRVDARLPDGSGRTGDGA